MKQVQSILHIPSSFKFLQTTVLAWRRIVAAIVLVVLIVAASANSAIAISPAQKQLMNAGVSDFNIEDDQTCSSTGGGGTVTANGTVTSDMASFIDAYGQMAFNVGKANGIPYDSILAQASLESNYGQSQLTKQANNFFGIKAGSNWTGPTVTFNTAEQTPSGGVYYVNAQFEAYANPQAGFQGYVDFLKRNPRYADAFNHQHDPIGYFQSLKNAGYATDVSYVDKLSSRLSAVDKYIASKGVLQPESQVTYDVQPSGAGAAGGATTAASSNSCTVVGAAGNATGIAAAALAELGNHYAKYTGGVQENWCADFVSWVYKTAGKPFSPTSGVAMRDGWQIPAVSELMTYLQTKGQFFMKSANAPAPQPGDIVIYKNGMSHTNIVVEANGYMVKTVGGNQESNDLTQSMVSESKGAFDIRNDSTVTGWGRLP